MYHVRTNKPKNLPSIFVDQTVLVTGAAGLVGTALIHRLVDPSLRVRRVFALVRGENPVSRFPKDLLPHITGITDNGHLDKKALVVVLSGDCSIPGFGVSEKQSRGLQEVDIVIHCAGNIRFNLSLPQAVKATSDLAYTACQFTLSHPKVRTHIHLSTCFTGWFLPSGSVFHEELVPAINNKVQYEGHVNSYFHAKSIAEGVVNAIGRQPTRNNIAWRVVRLSTLGPAMSFPTPGWGSGHPSSPVTAAIASHVADPAPWIPNAEIDILPIDIAINQTLGLAAAAHHTKNILPNGSNVPVYNIAAGDGSGLQIPMNIFNDPGLKIRRPYISPKNFAAAYRPILNKIVRFDTSRTRRVLGLPPYPETSFWSDSGEETGIIEGRTVWVTDTPIDLTGFEVDLDDALRKTGGWARYLQLIRSIMEKMVQPTDLSASPGPRL